ncbi:MAG: TIGR03118 family protein [Acidobacteriaceae bacterium]|nr:TIGR03118 family protein [Acidobacteriaceae bacterium]
MLRSVFSVSFLVLGSLAVSGASLDSFVQTNLTSDLPGVAAHQDPNLVNPWGIVAAPTSPFWISDNGSGLSTLYNGKGEAIPLVVTIPPPLGSSGPAAPTGIVFNSTSGFSGSHFIFGTENGTLASWASGATATLQATSPGGSVYKGLALGNNGSADLLYATNFGLGRVDVFDSSFHPMTVAGGFKDTTLPSGYAPFNIQSIGGNLYVTYALQDPAKHDDVAGAGHGFVDVFDMNGNLLRRLTSNGVLNSPWGLALAPAGFGGFGGDLLIGNFGDGEIHAYDPSSGALIGTLDSAGGSPVSIEGLWGLAFGNGTNEQGLGTLYFTAGIAGSGAKEDHGLFGSIAPTPEPAPAALLGGTGLAALLFLVARRRSTH